MPEQIRNAAANTWFMKLASQCQRFWRITGFSLVGSALFSARRLTAAEFQFADPRLEMPLFAAAPNIVTPIGAVCDPRGRLFVVESHTHTPPKDSAGPKHDRIKVFTDADADGRPAALAVVQSNGQHGLRASRKNRRPVRTVLRFSDRL